MAMMARQLIPRSAMPIIVVVIRAGILQNRPRWRRSFENISFVRLDLEMFFRSDFVSEYFLLIKSCLTFFSYILYRIFVS